MYMPFSYTMILGGLFYGKLAIFMHVLLNDEPGPRLVFNLVLSIAGISIGITAKAIEYRRGRVLQGGIK